MLKPYNYSQNFIVSMASSPFSILNVGGKHCEKINSVTYFPCGMLLSKLDHVLT